MSVKCTLERWKFYIGPRSMKSGRSDDSGLGPLSSSRDRI